MSQYTLFTVTAIFACMAQIDGIKAMLRDISVAKQVIKFAHTCTRLVHVWANFNFNHGQDCSFSQDLMTIFVMLNVQFEHGFCFTLLVLTVRTSMHGCYPIQKWKSDLFDP